MAKFPIASIPGCGMKFSTSGERNGFLQKLRKNFRNGIGGQVQRRNHADGKCPDWKSNKIGIAPGNKKTMCFAHRFFIPNQIHGQSCGGQSVNFPGYRGVRRYQTS